MLADGPRLRADLLRLAKTEGIAERTLGRARERLRVVVIRAETEGRPSTWELPDDHEDDDDPGDDEGDDDPGGYVPPAVGTYPLARTPQAPDQGKRRESGSTCHVPTRGTYPPDDRPAEGGGPSLTVAECNTLEDDDDTTDEETHR